MGYVCKNCGIVTLHIFHDLCANCLIGDKIHSYGYKPYPIFYKNNKENTDLFVGVELEINFNKKLSLADFLDNHNSDFVYYKHDGSLADYGVEIVSHPATFDYHFHNEWKNIFDALKDTNTNNCGLHFHLSKAAFNRNEIRMLDYFVNNFTNSISQIGSRALKNYCRAVNSNVYGLGRIIQSHTDACNLTNLHTIELRFCKSTNHFESFIRKIKMIFVLVSFIKELSKYNYKNVVACDKKQIEDCFEKAKGDILSRI